MDQRSAVKLVTAIPAPLSPPERGQGQTLFKHLRPGVSRILPPVDCPSCPTPRARKVGARGDIHSPLVILGEGPGTEELKYGAPFVGPSGDLLDKMLPEGFDLDTALILNAMQCRPPRRDIPRIAQEYKARACAACRSRVLDLVFAHPRRCILALGEWANVSLTNWTDFKITQRRGEVYEIEDRQGNPILVVPAVHPAFLLRGGGNPKTFRDDVSLALGLTYDHTTTKVLSDDWVDPSYSIVTSASQVRDIHHLLKQLVHKEETGEIVVACDIETSGFNFIEDYILSLGLYWRNAQDVAIIFPGLQLQGKSYRKAVRRLLRQKGLRLVWQFGKFDEKFLRRRGLIKRHEGLLHEDIGLQSYTLSEATKDHDLDEQAKNAVGAPNHKDMLKQWAPKKSSSYSKVPTPVLSDYLAKDLKKTLLVHEHKRPLVQQDPHLEKLYTRTLLPASRLLARIEEYGIHVDWDFVRINREGAIQDDVDRGLISASDLNVEIGLEREIAQYAEQLCAVAGYPVNPNSPGEVSDLLYDRYGLTIKGKRPGDTLKETLDKLPKHPAVELIRKARSAQKMLSTYVGAIETRAINDRIHTTFKLHVTPTGRLSSSEPNIQNIPRLPRFRRMYRARPGYILIEGDYNSAELRMLAALSGDVFLTAVFLDDKRNLHDEVAVAMYGASFNADQRIRAKAINFGIPYGREAYSIGEEFDLPTTEAQRLIDTWFKRSPQAADFIKRCRAAPLKGRTLITIFGRKRRPGVVSAERLHGLQNEFANFHMQSPISDFTLHSGMIMQPKIEKLGAHLVNLIHDSSLAECPDEPETVRQVAQIMKGTMEDVPTHWIDTPIRFKVDLKVGTHWGLLKGPSKAPTQYRLHELT